MIRGRVLCVVAVCVLSVGLYWSIRSNDVRQPGRVVVDRTKASAGRHLAFVKGSDADLWEFHDRFMLSLWPTYRTDSFVSVVRCKFRRFGLGSNYATQVVQNQRYARMSIDWHHELYFFDFGPAKVGVDKAIAALRGAGWDVEVIERKQGDESID